MRKFTVIQLVLGAIFVILTLPFITTFFVNPESWMVFYPPFTWIGIMFLLLLGLGSFFILQAARRQPIF